jgi:hypothetical protein
MATTPGSEPTRALAKLGILAGPRIGEELPVPSPVVHVGKGSQNEVVLPDDSVSTVHARLEYEGGHWRLTDLDSTNGTFVEGVRLAPSVPTPLFYGHSVRFGGVRMQFREVHDADPEAARARYAPPQAAPKVAERKGGFRLPVWLFALILLVLAAVAFFALGGTDLFEGGEPAPAEVPAQAAPDAPPGGP